MIKKIISLGVLLVFMLAFTAGCGDGIKYKANIYHESFSNGYPLPTIINSVDELKALCIEFNAYALDKDSSTYSSKLNEKIRAYNNTYFTRKSLILCQFSVNRGSKFRIDRLRIEDDILFVDILFNRVSTLAMIDIWTVLIEIKKSDIVGVTAIRYQFDYNIDE